MESHPQLTTWRLHELELGLEEDEQLLRARAARELGLEPGELRGFRIARKALDARRRSGLRFVLHADLVLEARKRTARMERLQRTGRLRPAPQTGSLLVAERHASFSRKHGASSPRAVVVGSGPAGLFAALALARNGVAVTLLERGPEIKSRSRRLARFHHRRELDPEANLLFGEGGAGTYSDGKIYTRVDDPLEVPLLEELVACGAPPSIVYDSMAHIGTDRLHRILPALRERMRAEGVEFAFETRMDGLALAPGDPSRVRAVRTARGEVPCDLLFLATGHSARDTWAALARQGVRMQAKPFQLGLRIEHPQDLIDRGRYGTSALARRLGASSYNLICRAGGGLPAAFSFCMCPGGRVVASINEPGLLCTNGMSNSRHSSAWASSALVTTFGPEHFGPGAFDGVRFQRELEQRFFEAGGGDYTAPAQTAEDFLAGRETPQPRHSTYPFGTRGARLDLLLPELGRASLARALCEFERRIPGFASQEGLFVGLESRSSGPVRLPRDASTRLAEGFSNLYPIGEGAGWAGGIMSAALDGANAALGCFTKGIPGP